MIYERSLMPAASSRSEWRSVDAMKVLSGGVQMAFFVFTAEFGRGQVHSLTVEER